MFVLIITLELYLTQKIPFLSLNSQYKGSITKKQESFKLIRE